MSMVKITPKFKNAEERNLIALAIGLSILLGGYVSFAPPLILYFGFPDKLSDSGKDILRQFLNFMINVAVIMLVLTVTVIGLPIAGLVFVVSLIFMIIDLLAVLNNSEVRIPVFFEALKASSDMSKKDEENESKAE